LFEQRGTHHVGVYRERQAIEGRPPSQRWLVELRCGFAHARRERARVNVPATDGSVAVCR